MVSLAPRWQWAGKGAAVKAGPSGKGRGEQPKAGDVASGGGGHAVPASGTYAEVACVSQIGCAHSRLSSCLCLNFQIKEEEICSHHPKSE